MSNSEVSDILARYEKNVLPQGENGEVDENKIQLAIEDAEAIIKAYLPEYDTCDTQRFAWAKPLCLDIALYRLSDSLSANDDLKVRYEEALKILKTRGGVQRTDTVLKSSALNFHKNKIL